MDSTPDIAYIDQLTFVLRYVLPDGNPTERFLAFLPMHGHTSEEIFNMVIDQLKLLGIKIDDCRGQSYDNASNMSGIYTGLQARIKTLNPLAEYIPCAGHSLNLVGVSAAESCVTAVDFFSFLQQLYNFFSVSTHRWDVLKRKMDSENVLKVKVPKNLSQTRWSARADACLALKGAYSVYKLALDELRAETTQPPKSRAEATGLIRKMEKLETAVLTVVWSAVLERFNKVNKQLQSVNMDLGTVEELYSSLSSFTNEVRGNFDCYEAEAKSFVETGTYHADENRQRSRKRHHDEIGSTADSVFTGRSKLIAEVNIMLDLLIAELDRRKIAYSKLNERLGFLTKLLVLDSPAISSKAKNLVDQFSGDIDDSFLS